MKYKRKNTTRGEKSYKLILDKLATKDLHGDLPAPCVKKSTHKPGFSERHSAIDR